MTAAAAAVAAEAAALGARLREWGIAPAVVSDDGAGSGSDDGSGRGR